MAILRSTEHFVDRASKVHNDFYRYNRTVYQGMEQSVVITCPEHGDFTQRANDHVNNKRGCQKCALQKKSQRLSIGRERFIERAREIHGTYYSYNSVQYINARTNVTIECPDHGPFEQAPARHIDRRAGCRKCTSTISKAESKWLDSLGVENHYRQVTLQINGKCYRVDALMNNIVYEFWGDYWHGNPEKYDQTAIHPVVNISFGELYRRTLDKRNVIIEAGYELVEIWESDFDNK